MVRVHLAGKHALKLESLDFGDEAADVALYFIRSRRIGLRGGHLQKLAGIGETARQVIEAVNDLFELGALFAEFLRAFGVVPDPGLLELASYFLQALALIVVIKDTSSRTLCAPRDL
jgi:hypothetical protein